MKLRNKKTGEIREIKNILIDGMFTVNSLAELNEEWEDYEEPKRGWYIDHSCIYEDLCLSEETSEKLKEIGNYFETKEEAEKAVGKLKAWKRLKDARFEFGTIKYNLDEESSSTIAYDGIITIKGMAYEDFVEDLDLLFGGVRMSSDFNKEWGFAPDQDYELRKCNKTPEEISKIMEVKKFGGEE